MPFVDESQFDHWLAKGTQACAQMLRQTVLDADDRQKIKGFIDEFDSLIKSYRNGYESSNTADLLIDAMSRLLGLWKLRCSSHLPPPSRAALMKLVAGKTDLMDCFPKESND